MITNDQLNLMYQKSLDKQEIDQDLLDYFAKLYIEEHHLNDVLEQVELNSKVDDCLGLFNSSRGIVKICQNTIIGRYEKNLKYKNSVDLYGKRNAFEVIYLAILHTLYHELTHAAQHKIVKDHNHDLITDLLEEEEFYMNEYPLYYNKYHDLYPTEHNADIEGFFELQKLNSIFNFKTNINSSLISSIKSGYHLYRPMASLSVAPYSILNSKLFSINVTHLDEAIDIRKRENKLLEKYKELPVKTRLSYGLPLTKDEYNNIKETVKTFSRTR